MGNLIIWALFSMVIFMCFGALYGAGSLSGSVLRSLDKKIRD